MIYEEVDVKSGRLKVKIVQYPNELPSLKGVQNIYLDVETNGLYPYIGDQICGIALLRDDEKIAWYIPYRHANQMWNVNADCVKLWLQGLENIPVWTNHNIKFDAHFIAEEGIDLSGMEFEDTIVLSKIWYSERFSYDLKKVTKEWLKEPMDEEVEVTSFLKSLKDDRGKKLKKEFQTYDKVPADMLGKYAAKDVYAVRELKKFLLIKLDKDLLTLWEMEKKITQLLFRMERRGIRVDSLEVKKESLKSFYRIIKAGEEIESITGQEFKDSSKHLGKILLSERDLPVLSYTDTKSPSFDKDAMAQYAVHPSVSSNPETKKLIKAICILRNESHFKSLFLDAYEKFADKNGLIHPSYNQLVRTGRLSCSIPNLQQADKRARKLLIPQEGYEFLSTDASQIEFRFIVHYIKDLQAIEAYKNDPFTDFHSWIAELCGVSRSAAKNVNFAMGYGAGKLKILRMLSANPDIIDEVREYMEKENIPYTRPVFERILAMKVLKIFTTYHDRFPGIHRVAKHATNVATARGFVFNIMKRRRYLPEKFAYKAFNTIIQGSAMDYIKDRMLELEQRFMNEDCFLVSNVHDEVLLEIPEGTFDQWNPIVNDVLSTIPEGMNLRVPIRWDANHSSNNWAEAKA